MTKHLRKTKSDNHESKFVRESYEDVRSVPVRIRVKVARPIDPTVLDVLTSIRGLQNVITVTQAGPMRPAPEGRNMLDLDVGFEDDESYDLPDLLRDIKRIRGVDMAFVPRRRFEEARHRVTEDTAGFRARVKKNLTSVRYLYALDGDFTKTQKMTAREIKRAFATEADHAWLSTLNTVHWTHSVALLAPLALASKRRDELSTTMSLPSDSLASSKLAIPSAFGLWVKGRITLAAHDMNALYTGYYSDDYQPRSATDLHRMRSSGINKLPMHIPTKVKFTESMPYILNAETWELDPGDPRSWDRSRVNEALVDNWHAIGLVVDARLVAPLRRAYEQGSRYVTDPALAENEKKLLDKVVDVALAFGVPIVDVDKQLVWKDSGPTKQEVSEARNILRSVVGGMVREALVSSRKLLVELKDYDDSRFADYGSSKYFVAPLRDKPEYVISVPLGARSDGISVQGLSKISHTFPGASVKDYDASPATIEAIEKLIAAGLAKKGEESKVTYPDITFKYARPEPGSPAAAWKSPDDVPETSTSYKVFGPDWAKGIIVDTNKGHVSMDVSIIGYMSRRQGDKPGKWNVFSQPQTYVIPSGDTTLATEQEVTKLLKHVAARDPRIVDYPIVGHEKYRGVTVGDFLTKKGPSEVQRALDPSTTGLVAYHGTSSKLAKQVTSKGLRPGKSQYSYSNLVPSWSEHNVYLTLDPTVAENYATRAAIWYGGTPTVLRVTVPDPAKLVVDEDAMRLVRLERPVTVRRRGATMTLDAVHPRDWFGGLADGWYEGTEPDAIEEIDRQIDAAVPAQLKNSLTGTESSFAYRGVIPPKFVEIWRQYPKVSYGKESTLTQAKYDLIRQQTLAQMKRFDEPK